MMRWVVVVALAACGRIGFVSDRRFDAGDSTSSSPCAPLGIVDNFDDNTTSPQWDAYSAAPLTVAETNGELEITLAANTGGSRYGGYASHTTLDLREHCMFATLAQTPTLADPTEVQFTVRLGQRYTGLTVISGMLKAIDQDANGTTELAAAPYDAVAMRVLRVRESAGITFYEYSADGIAFTTHTSLPTRFDVSSVIVVLGAGTYSSAPSPGQVAYDDFDL